MNTFKLIRFKMQTITVTDGINLIDTNNINAMEGCIPLRLYNNTYKDTVYRK